MIKRVLVPVDGSELSEQALVVAGDLAESLAGSILLVRVVPPVVATGSYSAKLRDQIEEAQVKDATEYLAKVAERLRQDRLDVETRVLTGPVAQTIAREAAKERCDLIAITSHGLGGLGSRVFGSVAQKLLQLAPCPVLVVRSTEPELEREEEYEAALSDEAMLRELSDAERRQRG